MGPSDGTSQGVVGPSDGASQRAWGVTPVGATVHRGDPGLVQLTWRVRGYPTVRVKYKS